MATTSQSNITLITDVISSTISEPEVVYAESIIAKILWLYISPIIIFLGTTGNILSAIVMSRKKLRETITSFYFTLLAFADTLVLWTGLLRNWLRYTFSVEVRSFSTVSCKFHTFLVYWSFHVSVWILVSVVIERLVKVFLPLKAKRIYTKRNVVIGMCSMCAFFVIVDSYWLVSQSLLSEDDVSNKVFNSYCTDNSDLAVHWSIYIFPWIDLTFYTILPFIIMISANIGIIIKVVYKGFLKNKTQVQTVNGNATSQNAHKSKVMNNMTATLLSVSFVFLFLSIPNCIYLALPVVYATPENDYQVSYHALYNLMIRYVCCSGFAGHLFACFSIISTPNRILTRGQ